MSAELRRARATARITAAQRAQDGQFDVGVNQAFDHVVPGEFGEPAVAGEASIEQFATEGDHLPIKLFIQSAEEAVDYTPAELRDLAFNLLAMAEVSEALYDQSEAGR